MKQKEFLRSYFFTAIFYCLLLTFSFSSLFAQRCETYNYYQRQIAINSYQNNSAQRSTTITRDTLANEVIVVPVVIHILYNTASQNISDAEVFSQLKTLNEDYRKLNADVIKVPAAFAAFAADTRISFCLAKTDPNGRSTTGIIRKHTSTENWLSDDEMKFSASGGDNAWDAKRYLNIWVCNLFGRTLGYSSVPGSQADKDGVVIQFNSFGTIGSLYPFNKGRTVTHEVGHWLGLKHLWGDASCGDDGIADTPQQQTYNEGCPSFPHVTICSKNSNGDMFMNFMDFTDDACMYMFTQGQKIKMRSLFAIGGARNSFLNSTACDSSALQAAPLPEDTLITTTSIFLYPNPAVKTIYVESKSASDIIDKTVKVFNVFGAEVLSQLMTNQKNIIQVDKLPAGIYFLRIGSQKDRNTFKFIKQ